MDGCESLRYGVGRSFPTECERRIVRAQVMQQTCRVPPPTCVVGSSLALSRSGSAIEHGHSATALASTSARLLNLPASIVARTSRGLRRATPRKVDFAVSAVRRRLPGLPPRSSRGRSSRSRLHRARLLEVDLDTEAVRANSLHKLDTLISSRGSSAPARGGVRALRPSGRAPPKELKDDVTVEVKSRWAAGLTPAARQVQQNDVTRFQAGSGPGADEATRGRLVPRLLGLSVQQRYGPAQCKHFPRQAERAPRSPDAASGRRWRSRS